MLLALARERQRRATDAAQSGEMPGMPETPDARPDARPDRGPGPCRRTSTSGGPITWTGRPTIRTTGSRRPANNQDVVHVTADELAELRAKINGLLDQYRRLRPEDRPAQAHRVGALVEFTPWFAPDEAS